jgi:hypothetical protein
MEKVNIMIFWGQEWSHPSGVLSATITLVTSSTRFFASFSISFTVLYWFFFWSYLNQGSFFLRFSAYIHINSHHVLKACARKQTYEQGKKCSRIHWPKNLTIWLCCHSPPWVTQESIPSQQSALETFIATGLLKEDLWSSPES